MKFFKYLFFIFIIFLYGCSNELSTYNQFMQVHFIDVGQGDAILVQVNDKNLLIDSGPKEKSTYFLNYLNSLNIEKLDYIIATHPHEDHIGNMYSVIKKYNIGEFFAPKIIHSSKSFEKMVEALISKNKKINTFNINTSLIDLGDNTKLHIYSPSSKDYGTNINLYSAVFKIEYGNTSFLFTGDSEKSNENDILNSKAYIKSDVLKVAHHGSSTSTSSSFLNLVSPSIAIISVGKDNVYDHPNSTVIELLKAKTKRIYRTDIDKTIVLISDGNSIYKKSSCK